MPRPRKISFIDLFSGAGGLAEGFINAGCVPIAHIEMNPDACDTLTTRTCYHYLQSIRELDRYYEYIRSLVPRDELLIKTPTPMLDSVIHETMSETSMKALYKRINRAKREKGITRVDLVIGGPPCQAYSQVGRSRKRMDDDPRNELYRLYCQVLERYQPEMFVFENVPGLLTAGEGRYIDNIREALCSIGYDLDFRIVTASDFGVLQRRQRIILIGWRQGSGHSYPTFAQQEIVANIGDILNDLPAVQAGQSSNEYLPGGYSEYLRENEIRTDDDILTWHIARPHIERDRDVYRLAIAAWADNHNRLRYTELPAELATHRNRHGFFDRFKVVADDLPTSHTMMAHISKDGHYYIHPDFDQARSLTVREAARIQSFPDSYYFEGSRTAAFTQIGNAVPPLMAKGIAEALVKELKKRRV